MKILVKVIPNARVESIERKGENEFLVKVREPAKENKANGAVIEILSDYFQVPKSQIFIVSGLRSREKIIKIEGGGHS